MDEWEFVCYSCRLALMELEKSDRLTGVMLNFLQRRKESEKIP